MAHRKLKPGETRYPKLPEPKRHFVSPRAQEVSARDLKPGDWIEVRDPHKRVMYGDGVFKVVRVGRVNVRASIDVRFSPDGPWHHQEHTIPLSHVVRAIPPSEVAPRGELEEAVGHRVADFNTLSDLIRHAGDEGATHVLVAGSNSKLYFPRSDGQYDEAKVFRQNGYWHLSAPSDRKTVHQLPADAAPVGEIGRRGVVRDYIAVDPRDRQVAGPFKHYSDARREADNAGGIVKFVPSRTVRAPSAAHRRTARGAEARGEQYAQNQLQGEYFQNWIREQLLEASRMDPNEVLPLETKRDAMVIARNMLQDLEEGAKRDLNKDAAFWKGFRSALDDSREWLADELLQIKSEMGGGKMNETPQRATGIRSRGARVEYAGSDPMKRGRTGTVISHSATDQVRVQWDGTGAGHDELIHVSNLRLLGGEKRRPKAKRSAPHRKR